MTDSTPHEDTREDTEAHALREYKYDVNGGDGVNDPDAEGVNTADVDGQRLRPPTNTDDTSKDDAEGHRLR